MTGRKYMRQLAIEDTNTGEIIYSHSNSLVLEKIDELNVLYPRRFRPYEIEVHDSSSSIVRYLEGKK